MILAINKENKLIVEHRAEVAIIDNMLCFRDTDGQIFRQPVDSKLFDRTIVADIVKNHGVTRKIVIHPGILINTLPKSGSVYIWNAISAGLNLPQTRISIDRFNHDIVVPKWAKRFNEEKNQVVHQHIPVTKINLFLLKQNNIDKLIVHSRDPRQSIISWIHHLDILPKSHTELNLIDMDIPFSNPCDYYMSLSMQQKIDLMLYYYLPIEINWISNWLRIADDPESGFKIFLTNFIDMKEKPVAFFESILDFYNIPLSFWNPPDLKPVEGKLHYRKGRTNEWQELFSPEQARIAKEMIPSELFQKFGWKY